MGNGFGCNPQVSDYFDAKLVPTNELAAKISGTVKQVAEARLHRNPAFLMAPLMHVSLPCLPPASSCPPTICMGRFLACLSAVSAPTNQVGLLKVHALQSQALK